MIRLTVGKCMDEKKVTRYALAKKTGIEYHIIDKYYKNQLVRYDSYILDRICEALDCTVADIIEYQKDEQPPK